MKKLLKSLVAIALVATMLVASMIVVSAKEENITAGATYTIVRLTEGPGSDEEEGPAWIAKGNGDDEGFTKLTDGWAKPAQSVTKSVFLAGSARTHRIKFDLGSVKEVSYVKLMMIDSYRSTYNGKHAANRGYNKDDGFAVYTDAAAKSSVKFKLTEEAIIDSETNEEVPYLFWVTLKLDKKVNTQYITLDIQAELAGKHPECEDDEDTPGAYVVAINEVEIYGGKASAATEKAEDPTQQQGSEAAGSEAAGSEATQAARPTSGTTDTGDSTSVVFIALIAVISLAGAAVVLKKRSF